MSLNEKYMKLAIELAKKGIGKVNPNPLVGAVIVKDGRIIGEGYHKEYGGSHAEVNAIDNAIESVEGATIYVTLEPCSHYGKTPPCVEKIIKNKIKKVVIGSVDPNPLVCGNGIKKLKDVGIEVETGVLENECNKLNEVFRKFIVKKKPFVVMKVAMSLDGKICTSSGESMWITGEESRENVHKLRNNLSGIMVGVDTVIKDNPKLTCRINGGRNPRVIIVDSTLRIPIDSNVIENRENNGIIIATTDLCDKEKKSVLESMGVRVLEIKAKKNRVDLNQLMAKLGELNIDSILLEGGSKLNFSALESKIVDKIQVYIAPKIIGGDKSKTPVGGDGVSKLKDSFKVNHMSVEKIGEDILLEGYLNQEED